MVKAIVPAEVGTVIALELPPVKLAITLFVSVSAVSLPTTVVVASGKVIDLLSEELAIRVVVLSAVVPSKSNVIPRELFVVSFTRPVPLAFNSKSRFASVPFPSNNNPLPVALFVRPK